MKIKILFVLVFFLKVAAQAQVPGFRMTETNVVCAGFFFEQMEEYNVGKTLGKETTKSVILVLKPYNRKLKTDYDKLYTDLGYKEVIVVQPPQYPTTRYRDSLKDFCFEHKVNVIAQVGYIYFMHSGISIGKIKRGWNEEIKYVGWDYIRRTYSWPAVSTVGRNVEELKEGYNKIIE